MLSRFWTWLFRSQTLQFLLIVLLIVLAAVFVAVLVSKSLEACVLESLGLEDDAKYEALKFLGISMGGILIALQALMSYKRAKAMEDTAKAQVDAAKAQARATEEQARANENAEQGLRQERLKNAIEHLGHDKDSVRLGGAYELFHLAEDNENLRKTAFDMLCLHIRQTTCENEYQKKHKSKPSEEVQSLLTLLFVQEHTVFKDLQINLQGSWLNGADLHGARLEKAILTKTHLQGATLAEAHLQEADLVQACMQGADLREAQLQKADLGKARLQGSILQGAKLQCAQLIESYLQGAFLYSTQLQEANLHWAYLQGAYLDSAHLQCAKLVGARLQGSILQGAKLQCADMEGAWLQGALLVLAQLQEADLTEALLHGVVSGNHGPQGIPIGPVASIPKDQIWRSFCKPSSFAKRLEDSIGRESDLSTVFFGGGLTKEYVDYLVEDLSDERANEFRKRLEPHVDVERPSSNQLPTDSGANTGSYPKRDAEIWINEYKEAMSEVPEDDN
jgi:uncharacterized protein YjbI with pentapeptide repeats